MKNKKIVLILISAILLIITYPWIRDKWVDHLLEDYPKTNYYTRILHRLEAPGTPEVCVVDGHEFMLASNRDENERLQLTAKNRKISFFYGMVKVKIENKTKEAVALGQYLDGLEFKDGKSWILSPGDRTPSTEMVVRVLPKEEIEIPFNINPRKMKKGSYRIICVYFIDRVGIIDYVELEYL